MAKAILLLSGGLDSTLAGKLMLEQGIEVEALNFVSPFCQCTPKSLGCSAARRSAEQLGINVRVFACGEDYLDLIKHPRFGRGRHMNPCIDCRIFIFSRAKQLMLELGADFVCTGEVLGERPMSQRRATMEIIERESGLEGLLVRPLCAKLLDSSIPEQEGKVNRDKLLSIEGRRRKPQMDLASKLGINDYLCPAGGCLLTDLEFSARLRDLFKHDPDCTMEAVRLLKTGRHFRLPNGAKVVVGRNQDENDAIERNAQSGDTLLVPRLVPGPSVLCQKPESADDVTLAAGLMMTYMKGGPEVEVVMGIAADGKEEKIVKGFHPLNKGIIDEWRVCAAPGSKSGMKEIQN